MKDRLKSLTSGGWDRLRFVVAGAIVVVALAAWGTITAINAVDIPSGPFGTVQDILDKDKSPAAAEQVAQATESIFVEVELLGDDKLSKAVDFYQFPGGWCYWWHHVPTGTGVAYDDGTRGLLIDSVTGNMMNYGWKAGDVRFTGPVGETLVLRFAPPPPETSCT